MMSCAEVMSIMRLDQNKFWIVPFEDHHITMANLRDIDADLLNAYGRPFIQQQKIHGLSFTALHEGTIIAMWGLYPLFKGKAEAWLIPTHELTHGKLTFQKGAKRFFPYSAQKCNLNRIQSFVCSTNVVAYKWIESMYFKREGRLKMFGPDDLDYFIYARIF